MTTKFCPPTRIVPIRAEDPGLAATVNVIVPSPEPPGSLVIVIHAALVVAVQAHSLPVVIEIDPVPPAAGIDWLVGDTV